MMLTDIIKLCDDVMLLHNKGENISIKIVVHGYTTLQVMAGDYNPAMNDFTARISVLLFDARLAHVIVTPFSKNIEVEYNEYFLDCINPHNIRCPAAWMNLIGKLAAQAGIREEMWE